MKQVDLVFNSNKLNYNLQICSKYVLINTDSASGKSSMLNAIRAIHRNRANKFHKRMELVTIIETPEAFEYSSIRSNKEADHIFL